MGSKRMLVDTAARINTDEILDRSYAVDEIKRKSVTSGGCNEKLSKRLE